MEIKKKAKNFFKEHKKVVIVGGMVIVNGVIMFKLGTNLAIKETLKVLSDMFGVDLRKDVVSNKIKCDVTAKLFCENGELPDAFKEIGINSLDDEIKGVILIQKK